MTYDSWEDKCESSPIVCCRDIQIVPGSLRPGSTTRRCPDVSKIAALGFAPIISLREGVQSTVDWYAKLPVAV
jgi:nucleoside-diphosphate-sugar epimerase